MAAILLRYMPQTFENQYWLQESLQPQNLRSLRNCLEATSVVVRDLRKRKESSEGSDSDNPNKLQKTGGPRERDKGPKEGSNPPVNAQMSKIGKFCHRCAKHGGAKRLITQPAEKI